MRLTDADERRALRAIAERHVEALSDDDLDVLGYDTWLAGLEAGFAAHHAGLVPPMKEAVEEAFSAGLLKVVFATETLSLGINMPARSVVIEKLSKFTGEHHEFLTPGEYTQLAGARAGAGIDDVGYVVVLWDPFVPFEQVAGLASRRTYALTSSFRPTYNMAANLVQRYPPRAGAPSPQPVVRAVPRRPRRRRRRTRPRAPPRASSRRPRPPRCIPRATSHEYRRLLADLDAARRAARGRVRRPVRGAAARRRGDRAQAGRQGRGAEAGAGQRAGTGCSR